MCLCAVQVLVREKRKRECVCPGSLGSAGQWRGRGGRHRGKVQQGGKEREYKLLQVTNALLFD